MPGASLMSFGDVADAFDDFVEDFLVHVEARTGAAALAVIEEDGAGGAGDGLVDIGIGEDDGGRFAAQLQRHLLQISGRGFHDQLAHFGGSGKGDLVDQIVRGQRRAGAFAVAGEDVDDACREAGFIDESAPGAGRRAASARPA